MSQRIARLLAEPEKTVTKLLTELENINGLPHHDARHIAQTHQLAAKKMSDLGLDPADTTAAELYHALLARFAQDSRCFDETYGVPHASFDDKVTLAVKLLRHSGRLPKLWALKNPAVKELLRSLPPKRTMKTLGCRSVDSMLKRRNLAEIMLVAQTLESGVWRAAFARAVSKTDQTAFQLRDINLVILPTSTWRDAGEGVAVSTEEAALAIWPTAANANDSLLSIILAFLEELERFGAHLKLGYLLEGDEVAAWWSDGDSLVADLKDGNVSFNIQDICESWRALSSFERRQTLRGRQEYWRQLIEKYEKKTGLQEIFDGSVMQKVRQLKFKAPQPAYEFEYAEEEF